MPLRAHPYVLVHAHTPIHPYTPMHSRKQAQTHIRTILKHILTYKKNKNTYTTAHTKLQLHIDTHTGVKYDFQKELFERLYYLIK